MGSVSAADVVIPACAVIGIAFALWQWFLVAKVKVSAYAPAGNGHGRAVFRAEGEDDDDAARIGGGGGDSDDEEDGGDGAAAVARCAEIQNAIAVGKSGEYFVFLIGRVQIGPC